MAENFSSSPSGEPPKDAAINGGNNLTDSSHAAGSDSASPLDSRNEPTIPARRKVYESTLLPERKRLRVPAVIAVPGILIIAGVLFVFAMNAGRPTRQIPTTGKIVFASDASSPGTPHIWIAGDDGSAPVQLTTGASAEQSPAFSPDGFQIAYLSNAAKGRNQVYLMDADGKGGHQLTRTAGSKAAPEFSPGDGALIGFIDAGAFSTANARTGELDKILPTDSPKKETGQTDDKGQDAADAPVPIVTSFSWSPVSDGSHRGVAAIEELNGLQIMEVLPDISAPPPPAQQGKPQPKAAGQSLSVAWSPNGALIAAAALKVAGFRKGHTASAIALYDGVGSAVPAPPMSVEQDKTTGPQNPIFTPDGESIVFERWDQPDLAHQKRLGLWITPKDGSAPPKQIYNGDARDARFLPDGTHLLFLSQRPDGGKDLCRINLDGSDFKRLTDGKSDVSSFSISMQGVGKKS